MLASLVAASMVAACGSPSRPPGSDGRGLHAESPREPIQDFLRTAWRPPLDPAITTQDVPWRTAAGDTVGGQLLLPGGHGAVPVVVYLPGLGESSEGGGQWRRAWAGAGYAVLSVQALPEDRDAFRSAEARAGEFGALGRERHAPRAVQERLEALAQFLSDAQRRTAAGEAPWNRLDWQRCAAAGFDIGSYSVMAWAGEHIPRVAPPEPLPTLRLVIALSPYPDLAGGVQPPRYAGIHVPVLGVSADADIDTLGLVSSPTLRQVPFEAMTGPGHALLWLRGLSHAALGAQTASERRSGSAEGAAPQEAGDRRQGRRDGGPSSGRGRGNRGDGGDRGNASGPSSADRPRRGDRPSERSADDVQRAKAALVAITTAALDARLKSDAQAARWLATQAAQWVRPVGELRAR